jgi:phosphorylase kinase alpha/beta subunit
MMMFDLFENTDAALLLTVGWPTFAIHDVTLVDHTVRKCIRKLRGTHGFKRYLRDGQYTDLESKEQRFYQETEIKVERIRWFNIESNDRLLLDYQ